MTLELRKAVARGGRVLAANGHSDLVWGHVSLRDPAGRGFWIKAAGLGFTEVEESQVQLVSWTGELLEGEGGIHIEQHIHARVMKARPDVNSVVHSHPEAAIVLGAAGIPLLPVGHEGTFFSPPDVARFHQTGDLIHDAALGDAVAAALGDRNALLLINHGIVVAESSLERAVFGAVLLEKASRMTLAAVTATGSVSAVLRSNDDEARAKRARCWSDKQVGLGWDFLARQTDDHQMRSDSL